MTEMTDPGKENEVASVWKGKEVRAAMITGGAGVIASIVAAIITTNAATSSALKSSVPEAVQNAIPQAIQDEVSSPEFNKRVRQMIAFEVDLLRVLSAGSITNTGNVSHVKGYPFSASREGGGVTKVNFHAPLAQGRPIVVTTPMESDCTVSVLGVDSTGFQVQGIDVGTSPMINRHVAFDFILVEPDMEAGEN